MSVTNEKTNHNSSFLGINNNELFANIILKKQLNQDQSIDELNRKVDELNFRLNNFITIRYNDNDLFHQSESGNYQMNHSDQIHLINKIVNEVQQLGELNDIRDQIADCVPICDETLELIQRYKNSNRSNFYKDTLRLFYQSIKRNYSKSLFSESQISVMLDMLKECKKYYIDEERYWEFDEQLYHVGLKVFPEVE